MRTDVFHYSIYVSGRVQGVGFRHEARKMARYMGIRGIVRNLADGRVYIEAEGDKDALDLFLSWCRKGSSFGSVDRVVSEEGEVKDYQGFNVVL